MRSRAVVAGIDGGDAVVARRCCDVARAIRAVGRELVVNGVRWCADPVVDLTACGGKAVRQAESEDAEVDASDRVVAIYVEEEVRVTAIVGRGRIGVAGLGQVSVWHRRRTGRVEEAWIATVRQLCAATSRGVVPNLTLRCDSAGAVGNEGFSSGRGDHDVTVRPDRSVAGRFERFLVGRAERLDSRTAARARLWGLDFGNGVAADGHGRETDELRERGLDSIADFHVQHEFAAIPRSRDPYLFGSGLVADRVGGDGVSGRTRGGCRKALVDIGFDVVRGRRASGRHGRQVPPTGDGRCIHCTLGGSTALVGVADVYNEGADTQNADQGEARQDEHGAALFAKTPAYPFG